MVLDTGTSLSKGALGHGGQIPARPDGRRAFGLLATTLDDRLSRQDEPEAAVEGFQTQAVATTLPAGASVVVSGYDLEAFWTRLKGTRLYTELAAIPTSARRSPRSPNRSASSRPRPDSRSTRPR